MEEVIMNTWSNPELIRTEEIGETLEFIYTENNIVVNAVYYLGEYVPKINKRVFKIIYSCVDGKWNKSERVYGRVQPALEEQYYFGENK